MKFSKVNAVRIPEGSSKEIRDGKKPIWSYILARYVSLGDSIAAGHSIDGDWKNRYGEGSQYGVNGNPETTVVRKSYTDLITADLRVRHKGRVLTTSFARSGDTVADLMEKLDHASVRRAIERANYVTVCIGANDILEPAFSHLQEYIGAGDLSGAEAVIENNFANLTNDSHPTSYTSLFNKLSAINPRAKYAFTTIYNPYKYLWLDEGRNGFFGPLLSIVPEMNLDVDEIIENMFFGGNNLVYFDLSSLEWKSIDLELDLGAIIKEGILLTPPFQLFFNRVNGLCDWAEKHVSRLNEILRVKVAAYKAVNPNFAVAESKSLFDTYPDRPVSAGIHYNDLVNVEYTRGYNTAMMSWGELWYDRYGDSAEGVKQYWLDLAWKYLIWSNGFPSLNVLDYVSFDLNGFAADLIQQIVEKVIIPDVDPHPEEYGQYVLKSSFASALGY